MVNTYVKGRKNEKEVLDILKRKYKDALVWRAIKSYYNKVDLFGLFDIMLKTKDTTYYVQVKTNYKGKIATLLNAKGREGISLKDFIDNYLGKNECVMIWNKKKVWFLYEYKK